MGASGHLDRHGQDLPLREVDLSPVFGSVTFDVPLEPPHDEVAEHLAPHPPPAVGQRGVEQLQQRGEARSRPSCGVAESRIRASAALARTSALARLAGVAPVVVLGPGIAVVVGLVEDHQVVAGPLQPVEDPVLLQVVHRGQRQRQVVERVRTQLASPCGSAPARPGRRRPGRQAEPLGHLALPLLQQRPGRSDDQDAADPAAGDQLGDNQPASIVLPRPTSSASRSLGRVILRQRATGRAGTARLRPARCTATRAPVPSACSSRNAWW